MKANVLVKSSSPVRGLLCDFGISISEEDIYQQFITSNMVTNIRWCAYELLYHEHINGIPVTTIWTDIYALGCVVLEVRTV